ncbi:hypothetical protein B0H21DRAFT_746395 [Amylocystis lapponica]|nr:hypothetical protein B0H21DRAFT_746395 [Amylocystis lapponica]
MALAKDQFYWKQLREVLTAGKWDASLPAKAPNGAMLSWSELLRKFNKHCHGFTDVAELASQTQALALLLSANAPDRSLDGNEASQHRPLAVGQECMLPEERLDEATAGYTALQKLESSNSDSIRLAVAYYAYALRRPSECLSVLGQVKTLTEIQDRIITSGSTRSNSLSVQIPGSASIGSVSSTLSGSLASVLSSGSTAEIGDGSSWTITESIRSVCLQGMSYEALSPDDTRKAFDAYLTARPLIVNVVSDIQPSVPQKPTPTQVNGVNAADSSSFLRYRELWRWVERLLRRAIILGSRLCDLRRTDKEHSMIWTLLDLYHSCSAHWPPTFRSAQRSTVAVLHLRAFVLRYGASPASGGQPEKAHRWISTARSVIQEYRAILSISTRFPRAGERNTRVEDLVDLSVAVWEADGAVGEYAGWVIDVLWWATRLTFNSYRVFRHMSRMFYVGGDPELAKRTLRLYVQVVSKAREAGLDDVDGSREDELPIGGDTDTDHNWVQTLVFGARMLCRLALVEEDGNKALEDAKEAGTMIEKAKTRLDASDKELVATVKLAEGIWNSVMAHTERDPRTRTIRLSTSLTHLLAAAETFTTPSGRYHLALAYARPGPAQDLQTAVENARLAVEGEPDEIRYWHLLGLLLTATGDWRGAKGVLEVGTGVGEVDPEEPVSEEPNSLPQNGVNGIHEQDFATAEPQTLRVNGDANGHTPNGHANPADTLIGDPVKILPDGEQQIPSSAFLLRPFSDRPSCSRQESFEHSLQLRMTQLTLTEYVEGPEGAGDKWVEVFQWFSERREVGLDDRRRSIDGNRDSEEIRAPSDVLSSEKVTPTHSTERRLSTSYSPETHTHPITVTPASPALPPPIYTRSSSSTDHSTADTETPTEKRSSSFEDGSRDRSRGKKVREKIGHNVGRHGAMHLKRANSAPNLHAVLGQAPYQASSIHLRQHLSIYASQQDLSLLQPPPPPPPPPLPSPSPTPTPNRRNYRAAKDRRLLSNLWLMSAATFRRLGKIEQARAAIQEAEVRDEENPTVWVQLGLYYMVLNDEPRALEAFRKALFIAPEHISATIHLCRLYLSSSTAPNSEAKTVQSRRANVDLAVGLLSDLTRGAGWDEYGLQGRKDRERECLSFALTLTEARAVRDIGTAVGWCL